MNNDKIYWKSDKDAYNEALSYVYKRKVGEIKSFKTPWDKVNYFGVDGLEWNSLTLIAARSGVGKTMIKDQIVRDACIFNKEKINILEFQFEMLARSTKVREFSSVIDKSYKHICSANTNIEGELTNDEYKELHQYVQKKINEESNIHIDIIDTPCTIPQMVDLIEKYMEVHSYIGKDKSGNDVKKYVNTVITLDHTYLVKQTDDESTKLEMLYDLGEMFTNLKRRYPIAFIALSQLNRNVEAPERAKEGTYANYLNTSDIFGADALMQHSDLVIEINRPSQFSIRWYGPEKYFIEDENVLVFHFNKCRTGSMGMSFFKAEYDKQKVIEIQTPKTKDNDTTGTNSNSQTSTGILTRRH